MTGTALGTGGTTTAEKSASESESLYCMASVQMRKIIQMSAAVFFQGCNNCTCGKHKGYAESAAFIADLKIEKSLRNLQFGRRRQACVSAIKLAILKKMGNLVELK